MGARHKLNSAYMQGAVAIAALLGFAFGSWWLFVIAAIVLLIGAVIGQEIRVSARPPRGRR